MHQMPSSSHNGGMLSKQNTLNSVLIAPQSPNDVYGFQQKAQLGQLENVSEFEFYTLGL